jgi:hypothetical protein
MRTIHSLAIGAAQGNSYLLTATRNGRSMICPDALHRERLGFEGAMGLPGSYLVPG